jgi:hypothetical protein
MSIIGKLVPLVHALHIIKQWLYTVSVSRHLIHEVQQRVSTCSIDRIQKPVYHFAQARS